MKQIFTANQRIKQWQRLLDQAHSKDLPKSYRIGDHSDDKDDDPFDCRDLILPETQELVQNVLKGHIQEWRDLDSRVVHRPQEEEENDDSGDGDGMENHEEDSSLRGGKKRQRRDEEGSTGGMVGDPKEGVHEEEEEEEEKGMSHEDGDEDNDEVSVEHDGVHDKTRSSSTASAWRRNNHFSNRVRLPDFFDYESKGPCPCPLSPPNGPKEKTKRKRRRKQVVSLEDPTKLLDYEVELWKIFQRVPLETDIEYEAVRGSICTNLLELREEIDTGYREYSRLDGHALSRLRKKDLHHWPRLRAIRKNDKKSDQINQRLDNEYDDYKIDCATIKLEFWRRQVKRFGSDPNKCEMEFLSTHTLLDVHNAIVDCTQDELFERGLGSQRQALLRGDNEDGDQQQQQQQQVEDATASSMSSGFFFIEGTFYSTGDVDYVTPVISWLNDHIDRRTVKSKKKTINRRSFLNIHNGESTTLDQKKMDQVTLGDIPMRLGIRYVHVCHGDVETSVFLSDVTMRMKDEIIEKSQYPLLHDIWTTSTSSLVHGVGVCEGCHHCPAVVLTIEDELADGGPTPFCRTCYEKLHYHGCGNHEKDVSESENTTTTTLRYNNFKVVPMSVLQNFIDLSVGHDSETTLF